jgi:putative redox protein
MTFEAQAPSGGSFVMDAYPDEGMVSKGPTPIEALLSSIAACSAMDVVAIMQKKRQIVTGYRVDVVGERVPKGEWPRPFLSITVRHVIQGENIDPAALQRAVELTDEKYCSVIATLRQAPKVESIWEIE